MDRLPGLDSWVGSNLEGLVELESSFDQAAVGQTLLHSDIRADNTLLTSSRVVFVDWPHAAIGASWIDLVYFLPSVAMQGGPAPNEAFWNHPLARGVDRDAVVSVLTGFAGFMIHVATQAPPPGLPTLRTFQLAQGLEAVRWLRAMLG